jgi:glycosyltransferase involved in cell wall biosynthesis
MKILLAMHNIIDPGGIVNHTYQLKLGLESLGHSVTCGIFTIGNDKIVETELVLDQEHLPRDVVIGYKTGTARAVAFIRSFDYVIWEVPIPTKAKANEGNKLWPELFNHGVPQVGIVHDRHVINRTPWVHHVLDKLTALVAVQTCGYLPCKDLSIPSCVIVNPFDLTEGLGTPFKSRSWAIAAACVWKPLKHMQDLVAAIPYLPFGVETITGGGGIEQCYMASKTKCKEAYKVNGVPIWGMAVDHGMQYMGFIQNADRVALYNRVKVVVDPSYVDEVPGAGNSLTRVFMEAAICGAIPVAREEYVDSAFFTAGVHYIPLPINTTPQVLAAALTAAVSMPEAEYDAMTAANYAATRKFGREVVAQKYLDLLDPKFRTKYCTTGKTSLDVITRSNKALTSFFGIKKVGGLSRWL